MELELAETNAVRINALSQVIAALIVLHPDPGSLAQMLKQMLVGTAVEQIAAHAPDATRQLYAETVNEMIQLAEDAHTSPPG